MNKRRERERENTMKLLEIWNAKALDTHNTIEIDYTLQLCDTISFAEFPYKTSSKTGHKQKMTHANEIAHMNMAENNEFRFHL